MSDTTPTTPELAKTIADLPATLKDPKPYKWAFQTVKEAYYSGKATQQEMFDAAELYIAAMKLWKKTSGSPLAKNAKIPSRFGLTR